MKKINFKLLLVLFCSSPITLKTSTIRSTLIKELRKIIRNKGAVGYNSEMDAKIKFERLLMLLNPKVSNEIKVTIKCLYPEYSKNMEKIIELLNKSDLDKPENISTFYNFLKKV